MIKPRIIVSSLVSIIAIGTVFFRFVEGWTWVDAYFFTVVTLSTVGYGSLVPATTLGKIFTTIFIFIGLGIFAIAIQQFGSYAVRKRQEQSDRKAARLDGHPHEENQQTHSANANEDPGP
jgi:voltage-gated potassium channel